MSHTDLFLTMCLRAKVCAEVITRGGLPVVGALSCLHRDGGCFMAWGRELLPSHLPDRRGSRPEGKELGNKQVGERDKNT